MGIILFITSIILTLIVGSLSIVFTPIYYIITFKWITGVRVLNRYFVNLAVSVDQFGNIIASELMNKTLIKNTEILPFGNIDFTISYVLGVNNEQQNLTFIGKLIERILNAIDPDHCVKAMLSQYKHDLDAKKRLVNRGTFYGLDEVEEIR